jgi:thiamine-monophosphate kinase
MVGMVARGQMVKRTTARPGDVLFVSGSIGDGGLGLALVRDPQAATRLGLSAAEASALIRRYRRPEPRLALAPALRQYASAAMDISDGLVKDLERLLEASGVAGRLVAADVPLSEPGRKALAAAPDLLAALITAGDDYEVLASVPEAGAGAFASAALAAGVPVARVGALLPGPPALTLIGPGGRPMSLPQRPGWDHF